MTDVALIEAFKKGGRALEISTQSFIENHVHLVDKVSKKIGLPSDQALDAFTDAVVDLTIQIRLDKFNGQSKIKTYFYRILYNKCVDLSRKKSTNVVDKELDYNNPSAQNIELDFQNKDMVDSLEQHFDKIGSPCKEILLDWGYWGYTMIEIAERNHLDSAKQAKDKKYRCLKLLKSIIPFNYE